MVPCLSSFQKYPCSFILINNNRCYGQKLVGYIIFSISIFYFNRARQDLKSNLKRQSIWKWKHKIKHNDFCLFIFLFWFQRFLLFWKIFVWLLGFLTMHAISTCTHQYKNRSWKYGITNTIWTIAPLYFHQNRQARIFSETRQAGHHENVQNFIPRLSGSREMSKTKVGTFFWITL